ncbi:hypothetical protein TNCV_555451 [Trichonephila clavipes]|nr:hypothetical protein TNCV_555451 [Trichonephila clavipes]
MESLHKGNSDGTDPDFVWGDYLEDTQSEAAPPTAFTHIVRVHYFVRGGFVGHRSRASSKHLSPHLPVGSLDSSGGVKQGLRCTCGRRIYKETDQMLLFSRSDVTALALSYGTFPLRKV